MLTDKIMELFKDKPEHIRKVIAEVIRFEQAHITEKMPRYTEEFRRIIDRAVDDAT
jgi:hypothetical protein